ncbi:hypothetical protein TBLA_0A09390 [Henningerozyma blattae CBS 6284]|uniref:Altered inheritance rate of mitochondria protein 29 n=1 Tax=Henningerozyma blattae (strain ATCC 34711 / CBS 6284 / DSM 70876 / NBRC 10599 / NRRL Y-10934 / UCD 77-7) TaxID=1071380 RepID=I2GX72_HENB6|nr:hypothetical protein TBLA_0A09390 [Tetrapisispora blattae CBS 6284]CCH58724.1 hypothetical protein TBLA_0A09390 [Tetrapisispora blattae CBS 6284]
MSNQTAFDFNQEEPLTSSSTPLTSCTITVRVIKSFPYRNVKNIIFHDYDLMTKSPQDLFEDSMKYININGSFRPFRNVKYDTLKVYTHAHGSKTVNLVINFEHDDDPKWLLDINESDKKLSDYFIENETEISLYKLDDYITYKANPEEKW